MPFGNVLAPSIGLSLLKAGLARHGVTSRIRYCSIRFAELAGLAFYSDIANDAKPSVRELPGEWIFSGAVFDATPADEDAYVREILLARSGWNTKIGVEPCPPSLVKKILRARALVAGFLDDCAREVLRDRPKIVGFTSVFQQQIPSLALAKRLKRAAPDLFIVLGGANNEHVMGAETVRQFAFVDAAVSGEGDLIVPELVRRVLASEPIDDLPGVRTRGGVAREFARGEFSSAPSVLTMDALPYPDYSDYVEQFRASRFQRAWQPRLFFESSRGCWWGAKKHCTFCGLNGSTMAFRSKSPRRAVDELVSLAAQHPGCDIQVVDNILDMDYFKNVLPELAARQVGLELFYETKSNLRKDQIRLLRAAGIVEIQPGIESFSDSVLALMRKGVTGLQNVQLLKWCKELGVRPCWNVLWGFPREDPAEYARMAALVPLLTHLTPPAGIAGIRLDRFSPNYFDADTLGFRDVTPLPAYLHVYPFPVPVVANLAYHFAFRYDDDREVDDYIRPLLGQLTAWKRVHRESDVFLVDARDHIVIWDTRPVSRRSVTVLAGLERVLYEACDRICDVRQLADAAEASGFPRASTEEIEHRLEPLVDAGLLVKQGTRYLALAVRLGEYSPAPRVVSRVLRLARQLGAPARAGAAVPLCALNGGGVLVPAAIERSTRRRATFPRSRSTRLCASQLSVTRRRELLVRFTAR